MEDYKLHSSKKLKRGLIVSCQAEKNEPLYGSENMALLAYAAEISGAIGIRALTAKDVYEIRKKVSLPIIGITKDRKSNGAFITIRKKDIDELVNAGADFVAIDCTDRERPEPLKELFEHIRNTYEGLGIVADISNLKEAKEVVKLNPDYISTTLSGYTSYTKNRDKPDLNLISEIVKITNIPVIAEGNYVYPKQARQAILNGAYSVVVGGAITRPQQITDRFNRAIRNVLNDFNSIGIDLGGTHIRIIKLNSKKEILDKEIVKTPETKELILKKLFELTDKYIDKNTKFLGIATAGRVNVKNGEIIFASKNLPDWIGMKLKEVFEKKYSLDVNVSNDANFAAYSQYLQSKKDLLYITVGTGIGSGIIIDGKICNGVNGNSGEIGHIIYPMNNNPCTCGKNGCIETLLSGKNLWKNLEENTEQKDKIFDDYSEKMAWLIDVVKNTIDFEEVYIGGVLPRYGEFLINLINEKYRNLSEINKENIFYSNVGELAGAYGAAVYSFEKWEEEL